MTSPDSYTGDADAWCQPMDCGKHTARKFIIYFDDPDHGLMVFDDEAEARATFEKKNTTWNCYLMGSLPLSRAPAPSRDDIAWIIDRVSKGHEKHQYYTPSLRALAKADAILALIAPSLSEVSRRDASPDEIAALNEAIDAATASTDQRQP